MALEGFADERRRRVLTVGESPSDRREYVRLHMDSDLLGLDGHGTALQTPSCNLKKFSLPPGETQSTGFQKLILF
jgi:hypothetical protein